MLKGTKIIEIGQAFSAPFAAETLGFLGAEVIKIERPGGDDTRGWGEPFLNDASVTFHMVNRNKKSVVLDLKNSEDKKRLRELIGTADVFIHNLRPGAAEKLGLGANDLRKKFPRLVYAELGAFGHLGPKKRDAGYEMLMQAFAGIMSITGEPDGAPVRTGPSISDFGSGLWLAVGVLAALNRRFKTGEGCVINTSIYEAALNWTTVPSGEYLAYGREPIRAGNGHPDLVPYGLFATQDGAIILGAGNDRLFEKFVTLAERPDLLSDVRFQSNASRIRHRAELEQQVNAIFQQDTSENWLARLAQAGVPCSPVQSIAQALEHPQSKALGIVQRVGDESGPGFIGVPLSFDGVRPKLRSVAPKIGEHTESELKKL